jgi:hypothetical protein
MTIYMIMAAFGGGLFGALIGALPAFIFTGFSGLIGVGLVMVGSDFDWLGTVTFGYLFGPHIAFAGGVAAAAFAANKKKVLGNGADILTSMNKFADPSILIVGGVFGVIGLLINYLLGSIWGTPTDTVAMTVWISGVIVRLVFGSSGLLGNKVEGRVYMPNGKGIVYDILLGVSLGAVIGFLAQWSGVAAIGFCISAATLIFAQAGFDAPATHHITLLAGVAALVTGSIWMAMVFASISAIIGDIGVTALNSECDSHIDPPAFAIFITTTMVLLIF